MDILKQVCPLEQAKQFKALGITDSYFVFNKYGEVEESWMHINEGDENIFYPALSVAELGAILQTKANNCYSLKGSQWITNLVPSPVYSTQAACYGAYLLHCLNKEYITPKEVKERLSELQDKISEK
jgi:hypothetical protein